MKYLKPQIKIKNIENESLLIGTSEGTGAGPQLGKSNNMGVDDEDDGSSDGTPWDGEDK